MRRHLKALAIAGALAAAWASTAYAQLGVVVFQENFNGVALGPSVNERLGFSFETHAVTDPGWNPRPNAFTHTPPADWVVDNNFNNFGNVDLNNPNYFTGQIVGNTGVPNQGDPANGVDEWEGWSFANKTFWSSVDDQDRSLFTNAIGTIAVADSDEYDDLGNGRGGGYMNTGLTTAAINVGAFAGQQITLDYDSSWRPESFDDAHTANPALAGASVNNQTAIIYAAFNGAAPDPFSGQVDFFDSQAGSPTFLTDTPNEHRTKVIDVPAGATSMKLTFAYINAANDWWWGIDNIAVTQGPTQVFSENFESLTLGPSVNERISANPTGKVTAANNDPPTQPRPNSFTHTGPAGWTVDNAGINPVAIGDNNRGVFEWEGWSFADQAFWLFAAQGDAASFTKAGGPFAIADSDEFADFGGGSPDVTRPMSTVLKTPTVDISAVPAGQLVMQFDSCWRPEGTAQQAIITVDYGSGEVEVLHWDSSGPLKHGEDAGGAPNLNETVLVQLNNPAGATTATVSFKYLNGSNNWFWAFDNVQIGALVPEPGSIALAALAAVGLAATSRRDRRRSIVAD